MNKDVVKIGHQDFFFENMPVRVILDDMDEPWWVAKDICDIIELDNVTKALLKLDDDEKGVKIIHTLGGPQKMATINEPGLYSLLIRSSKPKAKPFRRWVTHEVLPSIRKTGAYIHLEAAAQSIPEGHRVVSDDRLIELLEAENSHLKNLLGKRRSQNPRQARGDLNLPYFRKSFTQEEKELIVSLYADGVRPSEIAKRLGRAMGSITSLISSRRMAVN